MTVKKAIEGLDFLIKNKKELKVRLIDPESLLNGSNDIVSRFDRVMDFMLRKDVDILQAIKRQLLPEQHRTKIICKHPKKDHDVCAGQKYCMNCNADL